VPPPLKPRELNSHPASANAPLEVSRQERSGPRGPYNASSHNVYQESNRGTLTPRMGSDPKGNNTPPKSRRPLEWWLAFIGLLAAIAWRLCWPWTNIPADAVFLAVSSLGLLAALSLARPRR